MWPFKKPKTRNMAKELADELERQIISRSYKPEDVRYCYMCIQLIEARENGIIDIALEQYGCKYISSRMISGYATLKAMLDICTVDSFRTWDKSDRFGQHIAMYNWYWKLIRELRLEAWMFDLRQQ